MSRYGPGQMGFPATLTGCASVLKTNWLSWLADTCHGASCFIS